VPRGQRKNSKHPIDRGAPASVIAEKFGGLKQFTEALSRVRVDQGGNALAMSTVHRWLVRGTINGRDQDLVLAAAKLAKARVLLSDFIDTRAIEARMPAAAPEPAAV
jgi:hypothetical protein